MHLLLPWIRPLGPVIFAAIAVSMTGCGEHETVRSYSVPKTESLAAGRGSGSQAPLTGDARTLAAIVPHGEQAWFFKLTGPDDAVAAKSDDFRTLIQSVRFESASGGQPTWSVPEGWEQQPGDSMRYATLTSRGDQSNDQSDSEGPLELTVIPLPGPDADMDSYVLANVNRWRRQLGLPPIEADQLASETETVTLADDHTATLANLTGTAQPDGMRAPFAGGAGSAPPLSAGSGDASAPSGEPPSTGATDTVPLQYTAPESWQAAPAGGFRKAAFTVQDGAAQVEITVIDLAAAGGELLANVNRWRGQIGLAPVTAAELEEQVSQIDLGGVPGQYVRLYPAEDAESGQAILAVIAITGDRAWFFKLMGDAELARREQSRFEDFVRSVQFDSANGAVDGQ
ncbi:MAG: hypothetical protein WDZ59_10550 [Pirellulales bacterium]